MVNTNAGNQTDFAWKKNSLRDILGTGGKTHNGIVAALFAYRFGRIDLRKFIEFIGDRKEANRIKDIARENGYILKNCKLYAWACWKARQEGTSMPKASKFYVSKIDSLLLRRLNLNHISNDYHAFSYVGYDAMIDSVIRSSDIKDYIGKFVSKKMAFLMQSFGFDRNDLYQNLEEAAMLALYKQYPFHKNRLHAMNIARVAIKNAGQTFIKSQTSASRQRLSRNADGTFENVLMDIANVSDVAAPDNTDLRDSLVSLVSVSEQLAPRVQSFLLALAGKPDPGLSQFLKMDNTDAVDRMRYDRYVAAVQSYMGVTQAQTDKLFKRLRTEILSARL